MVAVAGSSVGPATLEKGGGGRCTARVDDDDKVFGCVIAPTITEEEALGCQQSS